MNEFENENHEGKKKVDLGSELCTKSWGRWEPKEKNTKRRKEKKEGEEGRRGVMMMEIVILTLFLKSKERRKEKS